MYRLDGGSSRKVEADEIPKLETTTISIQYSLFIH